VGCALHIAAWFLLVVPKWASSSSENALAFRLRTIVCDYSSAVDDLKLAFVRSVFSVFKKLVVLTSKIHKMGLNVADVILLRLHNLYSRISI
jgi:hypothetical protein